VRGQQVVAAGVEVEIAGAGLVAGLLQVVDALQDADAGQGQVADLDGCGAGSG